MSRWICARPSLGSPGLGTAVTWPGLSFIWFLTNRDGYFWPVWPIAGMGIGLVFAGFAAWAPNALRPSQSTYEREYQKLKNQRDGV